MKNFNLVVVENEKGVCLANDVTKIEIKDNELVFVYDNDECEGVYALDYTDSVVIRINR